MADSTTQVSVEEQDELKALLEYIEQDPAVQSPHEAAVIVAYSRMIRLVSLLRRGQVELSASHGMHVGDFDVLFLLQRTGERRIRVTDIATVLRVTPGGISKRIDRLVSASLVRREASLDDRRASVVILTDEGIKLANSARSLSRVDSFNALDEDEWRQFDAFLKRMLNAHARSSE